MKLTYKQLSFILEISQIEALEKMISIQCKLNGWTPPHSSETIKDYLKNTRFQTEMEIPVLSEHLGLEGLQMAVDDIKNNYLNRPASKKWILCDYPEKKMKECADKDKPMRIPFPSALGSLLSNDMANKIREEWRKRFPQAVV